MKNLLVAIYDNGGKTIDRYTAYFKKEPGSGNPLFYPCLSMSVDPFHPQGIGQHSEGMLGRHNGKRISFDSLPLDCQKLCLMEDSEK